MISGVCLCCRAAGEGGQVESRDCPPVHLLQQTAEPGTRLHLTARYGSSQSAANQPPLPRCDHLCLSPVSQQVSASALRSLCGFVRERRPLLVSVPSRPQQDLSRLPYATLRSLRVNTLVHALLRVTHSHISSGEPVTLAGGGASGAHVS